ncbi:MAG: acyltransferase [Verrucomicrobiota bacterium]
MKRFHQLDALRFFLAGIVVLGHCSGWERTLANGALAVDFFFHLSGFVLAHALFQKPQTSLLEFAISRFSRLAPLHYFTLSLLILFWFTQYLKLPYNEQGLPQALLNLLLLNGFIPSETYYYNWPSWSISAEFWLNLIVFFSIAKYRLRILSAFIAAAVLYLVLSSGKRLDHVLESFHFTTIAAARCLLGLCIGYLTYEVFNSVASLRFPSFPITLIEATLVAALFYSLDIDSFAGRLACWALIPPSILILSLKSGYLSRLLSIRLFAALGSLSYGIYLLHGPMLIIGKRLGLISSPGEMTLSSGFAILATSAALAIPLYRYLELPSKRYLNAKLKLKINKIPPR